MVEIKKILRFIFDNNDDIGIFKGRIIVFGIVKQIFENNKYREDIPPFIHALKDKGQVQIDFEDLNSRFEPSHHFKYQNGKVIKRNQSEIDEIEGILEQLRAEKLVEISEREEIIKQQKSILLDDSKSDKSRLNAMAKLIEFRGGI